MVTKTKSKDVMAYASTLIRNKAHEIYTAINEYCNKKLVDLGVLSKNSNLQLEYGHYKDSNFPSRVMHKLKVAIHRYFLKSTPYLHFSNSEFLDIRDDGSNSFTFSIISEDEDVDTSKADWRSVTDYSNLSHYEVYSNQNNIRLVIDSLRTGENYVRYGRYLNYIFRKYKIPMMCKVDVNLIPEASKFKELQLVTNSRLRNAAKLKASTQVKFMFQLVFWLKRDTLRNVADESLTDANYANTSCWAPNSFTATRVGTGIIRPSQYSPKSNIFKHFDKALKIVQTLTRKVYYDYSAYSFRNL